MENDYDGTYFNKILKKGKKTLFKLKNALFKFWKTTKNHRIEWSLTKSEEGKTFVGIVATYPVSIFFHLIHF